MLKESKIILRIKKTLTLVPAPETTLIMWGVFEITFLLRSEMSSVNPLVIREER